MQLVLFLVVSGLAGVLVAVLALPVAGSMGIVAQRGARSFEDLPAELEAGPLPTRSRLLAADGTVLAEFYDQDRVLVPLGAVAPVMRDALIAVEDARFYAHGGIDLRGTARALLNNSSGQQVQGGSTITQQYVKNVLLQNALDRGDEQAAREARDRSGPGGYQRKLRELRYATALEQRLSKDEILERYLNIAYFGDGAYGVEAAARRYFDEPAAHLRLHEAALLAGLVRNPSAYDPVRHPKAALARRNTVLQRMVDVGTVAPAEARRAQRRALDLRPGHERGGCDRSLAPFFCDYVKQTVLKDPAFGATATDRFNLLFRGGVTIRTTLDMGAQRAAQQAIAKRVYPDDEVGAAAVSIEPGTGALRAMALSRGYGTGKGHTKLNFAVNRDMGGSYGVQAGSTFKTYLATEALIRGYGFDFSLYAPRKMGEVKPVRTCRGYNRHGPGDPPYQPENPKKEANRFYDMRSGLARSINTYFMMLEERVGVCEASKRTEAMGVRQATGAPLAQVRSWTLGANHVSPLSMAEGYATYAARGKHCSPVAVASVTRRDGTQLPVPQSACQQVVDPAVADAVTYLLEGVLGAHGQNGTARGSALDRPAAGKTGTTDNSLAVWFVGFTPQLSTAVAAWNPFPGNQVYELRDRIIGGQYYRKPHGSDLAAPIWKDTMEGALKGQPKEAFQAPEQRFFTGTRQSDTLLP